MRTLPTNRHPKAGQSWTASELADLRLLVEAGVDWRAIGEKFGRTSEACRVRAAQLGMTRGGRRFKSEARKQRPSSSCVLS